VKRDEGFSRLAAAAHRSSTPTALHRRRVRSAIEHALQSDRYSETVERVDRALLLGLSRRRSPTRSPTLLLPVILIVAALVTFLGFVSSDRHAMRTGPSHAPALAPQPDRRPTARGTISATAAHSGSVLSRHIGRQ
jgi:hypothetical protein